MKKKLILLAIIALGLMSVAAKCPPPKPVKGPGAPIKSANAQDKVEIAWTIDGANNSTEFGRYDFPIAQWDTTIYKFNGDKHKSVSVTADKNYDGHIECHIWYFHQKLAYVVDFAVGVANTPAQCGANIADIDVAISESFGQPWDEQCACNPVEDELMIVVKWTLTG